MNCVCQHPDECNAVLGCGWFNYGKTQPSILLLWLDTLCVCVCLWVSVYLCVCMYTCITVSVYLCVCVTCTHLHVSSTEDTTSLYPPTEHTPTCTHLRNIHLLVPTYRTYMCHTWNIHLLVPTYRTYICHTWNVHFLVPTYRTYMCHTKHTVPPTEYRIYKTSLYPPTEHACAIHRTNRTYLYYYKTYNLLVLLTDYTELTYRLYRMYSTCTAYITYRTYKRTLRSKQTSRSRQTDIA